MKKLKIFPKMFIQIFSVLGIIIILVHSLVFFIFPKTYLETRKEKIYNIANEISSNMNGKEIKYIEQTLELYSKSSEIKAFIKEENNKKLDHLMSHLTVKKEEKTGEQIFRNMNFVITGSVEHFANRAQAKEFIESLGGKVTGSVTSKTNYLINNDTTSNSSKNKKAKELGIPILSEEDFLKMAQQ